MARRLISFSRQYRVSQRRHADAFRGTIISWRSQPLADLLIGSLGGTTLTNSNPISCCTGIPPQGFAFQAWPDFPSQALPQAHSLRNSLAVRRHSKRIEDGNSFNSQTNLRGGCGCVLPDERDLGLWISQNSRKSDKKGLVPESQPHSEIKIGLTFVCGIVLSPSYLAAPAEDFWNPPSACGETASLSGRWSLPEHSGPTYSGRHLAGAHGFKKMEFTEILIFSFPCSN